MSRVPDIEYSALKMLMEGERRMTEEGVTVWLAALNPSVLASHPFVCIRGPAGPGTPSFQCARGDQEVSGERRFGRCTSCAGRMKTTQ